MADQASKARILWITNLAAPYRIPVWKALADWADFEVALTEPDDDVGGSSSINRGSDWRSTAYPEVRFTALSTIRIRWRGRPLYFLRLRSGLRSMRNLDAVLVGGWDAPAYWQVLALSKLRGVRTVAFYESTPASHRFDRGPIASARRIFFNRVDAIVVSGVAARDGLIGMSVPPERIHTGFNAVDVQRFYEIAAQHRQEHPVDGSGHRFIYVGQLIRRKRVDRVIEAFHAMAEGNDLLTIVGEGEEQDRIRTIIRNLNMESQVKVIPAILNADVPAILSEQHTLVLASDEEVWGLVVNEALASGLNVVVSENCGVTASIKNMKGVHTAPTNSLSDISTAMRASRASWCGPIIEPEILSYTPQQFARIFYRALIRA